MTTPTKALLKLRAHAKVNLDLEVLRKRDDGFHEIRSRMAKISLADELVFRKGTTGDGLVLEIEGADLPIDESNLVVKAGKAFAEATGKPIDFEITLIKHVPSGAGLGGGSADAAATLDGLNQLTDAGLGIEELAKIGANIGSDVPFFLYDAACEVTGRGEHVEKLDFEWELPLLLVKPEFGVATPSAYKAWEESKEIPGLLYAPQICPWGRMVNDLERPVFEKFPVLADMKQWLLDQGETHAALMSGSGSTMLVVLAQQHGGEQLLKRAREEFGASLWGFVGHTLVTRIELDPTGLREPV